MFFCRLGSSGRGIGIFCQLRLIGDRTRLLKWGGTHQKKKNKNADTEKWGSEPMLAIKIEIICEQY